MKTCTKCWELKLLEAFRPGNGMKGRVKWCLRCEESSPRLGHLPPARKDTPTVPDSTSPTLPQPVRTQCAACEELKPVEDFVKNRGTVCAGCRKARLAETRAQREAEEAEWQVWCSRNPDLVARFGRRWTIEEARLHERRKSRARSRYQKTRDTRIAQQREWRSLNRERHLELARMAAHRRRAAKAGTAVEPVAPADLRGDWEGHDLHACFYCGGSLVDGYETEHFYPLKPDDEDAPSGPHARWNLVPSCAPCNRGVDGKHSREPWQFLRESLAEQGTDLDACLVILDTLRRRRCSDYRS